MAVPIRATETRFREFDRSLQTVLRRPELARPYATVSEEAQAVADAARAVISVCKRFGAKDPRDP